MELTWRWSDLAAATRGETVAALPPDYVTGISTDSRSIGAGDLFVALRGDRFDGHEYMRDAQVAGASAAVVDELYAERNRETAPLPLLVVKDTLQAYGALAHYHRHRCGVSVVAVTGSVGKSSTRQMIAEMLRKRFHVHETEKNYNNLVGTPKTLLDIGPGVDIAVLEHGIDRPGEMARLAGISEPNVGVVVSIAPCHLERLGTLEGIAREKGLLLLAVRSDGWGVINLDSPYSTYFQALVNRSLCFSTQRHAAVHSDLIETDAQACPRFQVHDRQGSWSCSLSAHGRHHVANALAAWCVGDIYEIPPEDRIAALAEFRGSWGRLNRRPGLKGSVILDDVYNANPASLLAALETLQCSSAERRIAVIGDMFDLGPLAEAYHLRLGQEIPSFRADYLVTLGKLSRNVASGALDSGMPKDRVFECENHEEVVQRLSELAEAGDLILVKASRGMAMEKIVEQLVSPQKA
ncbi:MAG: UDP-N-acetylmuramoyl-tripeptide--D-alanyl-D-alanine ligase [bacterium]